MFALYIINLLLFFAVINPVGGRFFLPVPDASAAVANSGGPPPPPSQAASGTSNDGSVAATNLQQAPPSASSQLGQAVPLPPSPFAPQPFPPVPPVSVAYVQPVRMPPFMPLYPVNPPAARVTPETPIISAASVALNTPTSPNCYMNRFGLLCCNASLERIMMAASSDMMTAYGSRMQMCNIQMITNAIQKKVEACFRGQQFEVITGVSDFGSRSRFPQELLCKIRMTDKIILAYSSTEMRKSSYDEGYMPENAIPDVDNYAEDEDSDYAELKETLKILSSLDSEATSDLL